MNSKISMINDVISICILILLSITAWKYKHIVGEYIPQSLIGLFIACALTNSSIFLPSSSLIIVLEYIWIINPVLVIVVGSLGAATGEMSGFLVGKFSRGIVTEKRMKTMRKHFKERPFVWIFFAAMTPFPLFDAIGIMSGLCNVNFIKFYLVCFLGKLIKMGIYSLVVLGVGYFL